MSEVVTAGREAALAAGYKVALDGVVELALTLVDLTLAGSALAGVELMPTWQGLKEDLLAPAEESQLVERGQLEPQLAVCFNVDFCFHIGIDSHEQLASHGNGRRHNAEEQQEVKEP